MNRNSQFDIYAVELEYYKHDTYEIIIPRMFGTEVKKEVVSAKSSSSGRRTWDEESYFQEVQNKLSAKQVTAIRKLYDWAVSNASEVRWGTGVTRASFSPVFESISNRSFVSVFSDGSVQISYGYLPDDLEIRKMLRSCLQNHIEVAGVTDVTDGALKSSYKSIPADYVQNNVDQILTGLTEFTSN